MLKVQSEFEWQDSSGQVMGTEERELGIEIDFSKAKTVLRFIGGPTGHESYYLEDLLPKIKQGDGDLLICFGTPGSWAKCTVKLDKLKTEMLKILTFDDPEGLFTAQYSGELGIWWII